mmetsp:Transcript_112012/g.157023  ORF Transcript_112012/g.157023 Transcript_112012/m.157023 type:complete len:197 (+) Transcript_112012:53-643(+)
MVEKTSAFDEDDAHVPLVEATPEIFEANEEMQEADVLKSVPQDDDAPVSGEEHNQMVASGTTGAVVGFLFGGPILSALLGFGAAYASKKEGATGDAARALGDMGVSVREKAIEVDEKHHIVEKSSQAAQNAWDNARQYDHQYNVLDKTKDFAVWSWQSFVSYVQEHKLLEKGVDGVGRGYEYVAEKVGGGDSGPRN